MLPVQIRSLVLILFALSCVAANANTYYVTSIASTGAGTLRQAITDANGNAGADTILFNINGTGVQTITLASALPPITDNVFIDGYSQPGAAHGAIGSRNILIAINGNSAASGASVFYFRLGSSGSSVCGFSVYNTGNATAVVYVASGTSNIHVWGNYIGTYANGVADAGSVLRYAAVYLGDVSSNPSPLTISNITIGVNGDGVNDANEGNVLSNANTASSGGMGIKLGYLQAVQQLKMIKISGNYIGMAADGNTPAPNGTSPVVDPNIAGFDGIITSLINGENVFIGTDGDGISDALESNLISGNAGNGIAIRSSNGISIAGNFIGTDITGTLARPNATKTVSTFYAGVAIAIELNSSLPKPPCYNIIIGFDDSRHTAAVAPDVRNVFAGNFAPAIDIYNVASPTTLGQHNNIKIAGNYIGVDKSGNIRLGNGQGTSPTNTYPGNGICVDNAARVTIGTNGNGINDDLERNITSGNIRGCRNSVGTQEHGV